MNKNLSSVSFRIGEAIVEFYNANLNAAAFRADDLRQHVINRVGIVAPGSADRVMRDMRQKNELNYTVVNRKQSLYKFLPVMVETATVAAGV